MSVRTWRILIIEDQADLADDARREIVEAFESDTEVKVVAEVETDFAAGYEKVRRGECDIVVLDVRRDASGSTPEDKIAGRKVFADIKKARFAPVIFWTALPGEVADQAIAPLVAVVSKGHTEELPVAIRAAIDSHAAEVIEDIERDVADVLREHMWTEMGPHWAEYTVGGDSAGITQVLVSRLARVLEGNRDLTFTTHPSHRYIYPPASKMHGPGDVLKQGQSWWIVLTPACDFEQNKADFVLLAKASSLVDHSKYKEWEAATGNKEGDKWASLRQNVLMSTNGRFYYLPEFRDIPDLVVDLQQVVSVKTEELSAYRAVAALSSPFAEALLVQHSHYRGRIGVPDLNTAILKERFLAGSPPTP